MKRIGTILMVLVALLAMVGMVSAETTGEGTTGGTTLVGNVDSIDLCTKTIPILSGTGWGVCAVDAVTSGTFSHEISGATLKFNAEASGLGGFTYDYPEVSDLALAGVTKTTLIWTWTTPDRAYFIKNIVTVKETGTTNIVHTGEKAPGANKPVELVVTGLTAGTSYTITVQSEYSEPVSASDVKYSLIYYRDSDPANVDPSNTGYMVLDQTLSVSGMVEFSGYRFIGDNIPMEDDVNVRGKIWIVPTSELNDDGTLKWTGYGAGNTMTDYLFESDLIVGGSTPAEWMGGIIYNYVTPP